MQSGVGQVAAVFHITNDREMNQELKINMISLNGSAFRGTLAPLEAKHSIYKEILQLDLDNFDGVRFG
jgi:hypothetical protein